MALQKRKRDLEISIKRISNRSGGIGAILYMAMRSLCSELRCFEDGMSLMRGKGRIYIAEEKREEAYGRQQANPQGVGTR